MEGTYQYPIFFECLNLDGEQKKRIEKYFHISRKSGGGDCGSVTNIHDQVYRIAFRKRDAQQRVLQRTQHVLELAGGPLVLTVRGNPEPTSKSVRPKLDLTSSQQQSPQSIPASTPPPSGEEYELQLDSYLLRYLKESPEAGKELERKLASVACSAQLYPEEGRVLVRSLAQPGAVDEVRNWRAEVDKLFDGYLCHYELDPHKVKALLQTTDEVKVYSEVGLVVVVGEHSRVKARLMDVEDSHVKQKSHLSEKKTTICRLGEAKLRLLWKEIEHSLGRDFQGVKVTQGDAGQLVLEGSAEEILKARGWISDKEKSVLERKVSDMSQHFWAFLRKAYGGPAVLGDFLGVGDKVEVELRDTELRFFTLTADKLDDTEKKLREKFKEVKIDVPNCSAVPPELQEKLKAKTNELNQGQHRVQVVFGSDSTVCLLGHTKEVEELSEAVTQFMLDQSSIEGKVVLPSPELAQELPAVMDLPEAQRYFLSSDSQKCLVQLREQHHATSQTSVSGARLSDVNTTVASYSLRDGLQVLVCQGDITKQHADALVNAANEDLDHCGGVAAALSKAGGPEVQSESDALVKHFGKIPTGDVVVTTGGNLNCKKLLHAVGPVGGNVGGRERMLLEKTVQSALFSAEIMKLKSIAMPCISSGVFGVPVPVCSDAIVTAVMRFGRQGGQSLRRIILIDNRPEVVRAMQEACDRLLQGITTGGIGFQMGDAARGTTAGAPGDGVHVEIIHGATETQQDLQSAQETPHLRGFTNDANPDQASNTRRIVILGKTGFGKSSLANTIFGKELFKIDRTVNSGTSKCQAKTKSVNGRNISLIDTPGLFDTDRSEEELEAEIVRSITECSPGPHAFLIVLKVEKYTEQEQAVINKICQYFSEEALKHATLVFTHGDQLPEGLTIEDFVHQNKRKNKPLIDLVKKCGGRCHVIDNRHWNENPKDKYRSNRFQVEELLKSIDKMVMENNGSCYTNEMLQAVEEEIQQEEEHIRQSSPKMSEKEVREQAKVNVSTKLLVRLAGAVSEALFGAVVTGGVAALGGTAVGTALETAAAAAVGTALGGAAAAAVGTALGGPAAAAAVVVGPALAGPAAAAVGAALGGGPLAVAAAAAVKAALRGTAARGTT